MNGTRLSAALLVTLSLVGAGCPDNSVPTVPPVSNIPLVPAIPSVPIVSDAIIINDKNGADYQPAIDPANFVAVINHPFFTLIPGEKLTYEGNTEVGVKQRNEVEVTTNTKTILGVTTTEVRDRVYENDVLTEDALDWYAQDKSGNVWYFGEDSKELSDGIVTSTIGTWTAGVDGAQPGLIMKAQPKPGVAYRQEFYKGEAEDMAEVVGVDSSVNITQGEYFHCLQVKEWTRLEPAIVEEKFYCNEIGNLVFEKTVVGGTGKMELIKIEKP